MHIGMDRNGNVVVAGEGMHRMPVATGEVDLMMHSPAATAELLREHEAAETLGQNAMLDQMQAEQEEYDREQAVQEALAFDYENYQQEAINQVYGGENPSLYLAAVQTMMGGLEDFKTPMSGYGLSHDGAHDVRSHVSGRRPRGVHFGDFFSDLTDQLSSATADASAIASQVSDVAQAVSDVTGGDDQSAAPAAPGVPAVAKPKAAVAVPGKGLMSKKVLGLPLPIVALGGAALAYALVSMGGKKRAYA